MITLNSTTSKKNPSKNLSISFVHHWCYSYLGTRSPAQLIETKVTVALVMLYPKPIRMAKSKPIEFFPRSLLPTEEKYSASEPEYLAVICVRTVPHVWAIHRPYFHAIFN